MPGDVIYFPAIGPLAAVSGSVNHPAIFELRGDPTIRHDPSRIPLLLGRVEHRRPRISDRRAGGDGAVTARP